MTYDLTIYVVNDPVISVCLAALAGVIVFKIAYKLIELIPGM